MIFALACTATPSKADEKTNEKSSASRSREKSRQPSSRIKSKRNTNRSKSGEARQELVDALRLVKIGKFEEASIKLFQLSHSPRFRDRKMQIKYLLGLMLYQMKLPQVAAFQFISVVKDGNNKYLRQSLEKLSLAADSLGDDTMLNYAISRVKVDDFPRVHRDMLFYRIGEFQLRNQQFQEAAQSFQRVASSSSLYPRSKYLEGLAQAESGNVKKAFDAFEELADGREAYGVTDVSRVSGLIGKARVLYQAKKWEEAIEAYRQVPVDTEAWHETLFESSWAMLRSGRFRSALSNFHSLHSDYYEERYLPESLLLRSIVYLYICKYDEMEKVLNLFNKLYKPVYKDVLAFLKNRSPDQYFVEVAEKFIRWKNQDDSSDSVSKGGIPLTVVRKIFKEGDFLRSYAYIKRILKEKELLEAMDIKWRKSAIGVYSKKILQKRLVKARKRAGLQVRAHLESIREDLFDLFEQEGFIRYEMINGKKESIKKKLAGKDLPEEEQIDDGSERDYYVQNGYEYWPFRGEYWLDELGNYHYVGTQSCN
ncbi:MAG: tetratricopeptide repeat protein [Bdellovibrionales bacterium]|nr:tetratricopeptide repeat protein [Bdellovibrionales bacterium]